MSNVKYASLATVANKLYIGTILYICFSKFMIIMEVNVLFSLTR